MQKSSINHISPTIKQYLTLKESYKDCILLYRIGEFYEIFFEDAVIASSILNIALTSKNKIGDQKVPLCGFPATSKNNHIRKLLAYNHKVALCEQFENNTSAKSLMNREVVRVFTPGTIVEEDLLDSKSVNYIAAIYAQNNQAYVVWSDISIGMVFFKKMHIDYIEHEIASLQPTEVLTTDRTLLNMLKESANINLRPEPSISMQDLEQYLELQTTVSHPVQYTFAILLEYLSYTHKNDVPKMFWIQDIEDSHYVFISKSAMQNLEIFKDSNGKSDNSLFHTMNRTNTASGSRLLHQYLRAPLKDIETINNRLDSIEFFYRHPKLSEVIKDIMINFPDLERAINSAIKYQKPKELHIIKLALIAAKKLNEAMSHYYQELPDILRQNIINLVPGSNLLASLEKALLEYTEEYSINPNFDPYLKALHTEYRSSIEKITKLQIQLRTTFKIHHLKVMKNSILGYYIEIPLPINEDLHKNPNFSHIQTLNNSVRYNYTELAQITQEIDRKYNMIMEYEKKISEKFYKVIKQHRHDFYLIANSIAIIDVASSLAKLAIEQRYVRPNITNNYNDFQISEGRHPILSIKNQQQFIANDCLMNQHSLWLITGPNMSGKSTFLRQNILIALMAQIGSFVPANAATIGIIDQIYARIGAGDDIYHGRSTFMMEMIEVAEILIKATEKSFVILDEVGRGTSATEGEAIAQAILEHLEQNIKCRTLFATHYHSLANSDASESKSAIKPNAYYMDFIEEHENLKFLYKIKYGKSELSYGLHVAKIAGIPKLLLERAKEIISKNQANSHS